MNVPASTFIISILTPSLTGIVTVLADYEGWFLYDSSIKVISSFVPSVSFTCLGTQPKNVTVTVIEEDFALIIKFTSISVTEIRETSRQLRLFKKLLL